MSDELDTGAPEGDGLSLRDELAAALGADVGASDGPSGVSPPAPDATAANPTPAPADGRVRDEQGRFAPKSEAAPQASTQPQTPQAPAAAVETGQSIPVQQPSGPPASWSAAAKAEFDKLSPTIQQEVLKREADIQRGLAQQQSNAERLNRLTALFQPRAEKLRMAGVDEVQAIQSLLAAQDYLERDPVNAVAYLARQYGVDLRAFGQMQGQQQPQAQLQPEIQALVNEVGTLKQTLAQQQQATEHSVRQGYVDQVNAFRSNPANLYFDNVKGRMAKLIEAGAASSLEDAYQQAIWADPDVRPILLREQTQAGTEAARAKASQAKHASGSVTGSPAPGSSPGRQGPAPTLRDELMNAFSQHAA